VPPTNIVLLVQPESTSSKTNVSLHVQLVLTNTMNPTLVDTVMLDVPPVKMKHIEIAENVTIHTFSSKLLAYNALIVNQTKDTSVITKLTNVTNVTTTV
jgi:hypothetical protein